jgi:uncharacterized protein YbjT (DUF2867 family)
VILVTGAGGAVGSALLAELRPAGVPVRAAYHSPDQADRDIRAGHHAVTVDLAEPATLPPALDGIDAVFLLGAMSPDQTDHELNLVRAAGSAGVARLVKLSVLRADELLTPIAALHRPVEEALESSQLTWTFLRPNFYMQNFIRQAARIKDTGTLAQPATTAPISFTDVRDIASVAARTLTSSGHERSIYTITGPQALTYEEAAVTFTRVLGKPVRFTPLSDAEARAGMLRGGIPEFHADALIAVSQAYRHGGAEQVTSTVQDLTGRDPITFEQFVRDHQAAFS